MDWWLLSGFKNLGQGLHVTRAPVPALMAAHLSRTAAARARDPIALVAHTVVVVAACFA